MPELSIIIPAYNEEGRLPATILSVHQYLVRRGGEFEIIIVDDGSHDGTAAFVTEFAKTHENVRLLSYGPNRGKGFAIRSGILAARGALLLINDADGSSPIEEVERLLQAVAAGADVAIGSRAKPDESRKVDALAYRKLLGNTFNAIVQGLLLPGIYDTQCGFKLFKSGVGKDVFSVATIDGFGFDVEVLHIAKLRNYTIAEVPINWHNVDGSKVNVFWDSPKMFMEVLLIKLGGLLGRYKQLPAVRNEETPS